MRAEPLDAEVYRRAEQLLAHNRSRLGLRLSVEPSWPEGCDSLAYRVEAEAGPEFVVVEVPSGRRRPAFDHDRLYAALAGASEREVDPMRPPFASIEVAGNEIRFDAFGWRWVFDTATGACRAENDVTSLLERTSPDGEWVALAVGDDLWVRRTATGEEFPVTSDGTPERSYVRSFDSSGLGELLDRQIGVRRPPVARWSPDSRRIFFHRTDQTEVERITITAAAPRDGGRPRERSFAAALPGDPGYPRADFFLFDVEGRELIPVDAPSIDVVLRSPIPRGWTWWPDDGTKVHYLSTSRDVRTLSLGVIDAATGEQRILIEEVGATRVEPTQRVELPPAVKILAGGTEAIWFSQRDGWGHLHLYDLRTGEPIRQITRGPFLVQQILHVDETARVAHLVVSGLDDDPYLRDLVVVGLDTGELTRLTDDGLDHAVTASPDGRWFVDSASDVSTPPVITVRDRDGAVVVELERGDVSRLIEAGWIPPERVRTIAADGVTPIYGVLHKPFGFDPAVGYPVIDHVYPGPQVIRVMPSFHDPQGSTPTAEAMAALGFVVVAFDGRGTPSRDKAFHDHSNRNMGGAGALEDHVAALTQLGETRPWLDLERVGITGLSGGGFATARAMLRFPEFFGVGVAEAGNHDNRVYWASWAETYDGPYDPGQDESLSNTLLADRLEGKLLLVHGETDGNVTVHQTLRLVDALIAAEKDFDMLIVPGADHVFTEHQHYLTRKRWDYFVRHLLHREPPAYRLAPFPIPEERQRVRDVLAMLY